MRRILGLFLLGVALAQGGTYVVRPGDTLFSIARRFGTRVEVLARLNRLADPDRIQAGTVLKLPVPPAPAGVGLDPYPLVQGRPVWVRPPAGTAWVALDGVRARVHRGRALLPVAATAAVGRHPLVLSGGRRATVFVATGGYPTRDLTLPKGKGRLFDRATIARERRAILAACQKGPPEPLWRRPWRWPLARPVVSAPFGERRRYDGRPGGYHAGLDLAAPAGTPVRAAAPGRVALVARFRVRGNAVVLVHGAGVCAVYQHLKGAAVRPGASVRPGALLGWVGTTGLSTGPHLHLEVRLLGLPQDPRFFLEAR